jgi:hypothetical protein
MKRIVLITVLLFTAMLCVRAFAQTASSSGPGSPDPGNVTPPTVTRAVSDQKFDPNFGIPSPDVANKSRNVVNPETAKWVTSFLIFVSLVPIGFAIRQSIKGSSLLPIAVALSGAAGVFAEVYTDVLVPSIGQTLQVPSLLAPSFTFSAGICLLSLCLHGSHLAHV